MLRSLATAAPAVRNLLGARRRNLSKHYITACPLPLCPQKSPYNWSEQLYERHGNTIVNYLTSTVTAAFPSAPAYFAAPAHRLRPRGRMKRLGHG